MKRFLPPRVMDGEDLEVADGWVDAVYLHGVLQNADGGTRMNDEAELGLMRGFVGAFDLVPMSTIRRLGRHIMSKVTS